MSYRINPRTIRYRNLDKGVFTSVIQKSSLSDYTYANKTEKRTIKETMTGEMIMIRT